MHFSDKKDETQFVGISSEGKTQLKCKDFSVKDVPENQPMKRMKYLALSEDLEMQSYSSLKLSEKCSTKFPQGKRFGPMKRDLDTMDFLYQDQKISKGVTTVQMASKFANEEAPRLCEANNVKTNRHFIEVKRRPHNVS